MFRSCSAIIRLTKQWRNVPWQTPLFRKPDDGRVMPKHVAYLNSCTNLQLLFILLRKDGIN